MLALEDELDMLLPETAVAKVDFGAEAFLNEDTLVTEGWADPQRGYYAVVFTRGNEALKIYSAEDIGYHAWITHAPNHGGPFPRRISIPQRVTFSVRRWTYNAYMVLLERLQPLLSPDIRETIYDVYDALLATKRKKQQRPRLDEFAKTLGENFITAIHVALDIIDECPNPDDLSLDLHIPNVMVRPSTGELVLTDPLARYC